MLTNTKINFNHLNLLSLLCYGLRNKLPFNVGATLVVAQNENKKEGRHKAMPLHLTSYVNPLDSKGLHVAQYERRIILVKNLIIVCLIIRRINIGVC